MLQRHNFKLEDLLGSNNVIETNNSMDIIQEQASFFVAGQILVIKSGNSTELGIKEGVDWEFRDFGIFLFSFLDIIIFIY